MGFAAVQSEAFNSIKVKMSKNYLDIFVELMYDGSKYKKQYSKRSTSYKINSK